MFRHMAPLSGESADKFLVRLKKKQARHCKALGDNLRDPRLCSKSAQSPEATNIWPRATKNIFLVARPGDLLVLVS